MKVLMSENHKKILEDKINRTYLICKILWGIILIVSAISSFFFGIQMLLVGAVVALFVGYYYYELYKKENDKENLIFIETNCVKKKISGYRLQYHTSTFEYDEITQNNNNESNKEKGLFKITHSDKNKFKEGQSYLFCIHLSEGKTLSDVSLGDVVSYCLKKEKS